MLFIVNTDLIYCRYNGSEFSLQSPLTAISSTLQFSRLNIVSNKIFPGIFADPLAPVFFKSAFEATASRSIIYRDFTFSNQKF